MEFHFNFIHYNKQPEMVFSEDESSSEEQTTAHFKKVYLVTPTGAKMVI